MTAILINSAAENRLTNTPLQGELANLQIALHIIQLSVMETSQTTAVRARKFLENGYFYTICTYNDILLCITMYILFLNFTTCHFEKLLCQRGERDKLNQHSLVFSFHWFFRPFHMNMTFDLTFSYEHDIRLELR
jgi:hypothetical protein